MESEIKLIEYNNEYSIEIPLQDRIKDCLNKIKRKRYDSKSKRWLIMKDQKDTFSKALKSYANVTISKNNRKNPKHDEIELNIESEEEFMYVGISNYMTVSNRCKSLIDLFRSMPERHFLKDTNKWQFNIIDKDMLVNGIQMIKDDENLNIVYNDF